MTKTCECGALVASYERLTALYHDLLGQESLAALLERAAETVAELVPCSSLLIAEADIEQQIIVPLVVRGAWQEETLQMRPRFGEGRNCDALQSLVHRARHLGRDRGHLQSGQQGPESARSSPHQRKAFRYDYGLQIRRIESAWPVHQEEIDHRGGICDYGHVE